MALYDGQGQLLRQHDFNLGRGDALVALRWSARGIVAVGSADWDRWQGGMSISRGARPLVVWFAPGAAEAGQRVIPLGEPSRHWNLHDRTAAVESRRAKVSKKAAAVDKLGMKTRVLHSPSTVLPKLLPRRRLAVAPSAD